MQRVRAATATAALLSRDQRLTADIVSLLSDETTTLDVHTSFRALSAAVATAMPDVVIVDDRAGDNAQHDIRQLRRRQPSVYIIYVGARNEQRCISLLQWGADDAIVVKTPLLPARLLATMRRARTVNAGTRIAVGDIVVDRESHRVWCAGREVELTPHEFSVVDCLFWHAPKPVGVDTLADYVWGDHSDDNKRSRVQTYISYVRKKLAASAKVAIRFAKGAGYEFTPRDEKGDK